MIACMGGWCLKRQQCPHYIEAKSQEPSERLCVPGKDGVRLVSASAFRVVAVDVMTGQEVREVA